MKKLPGIVALVWWILFWMLAAGIVWLQYQQGTTSLERATTAIALIVGVAVVGPFVFKSLYRRAISSPEGSREHKIIGVLGGVAAAFVADFILGLHPLLVLLTWAAVVLIYWKAWKVI